MSAPIQIESPPSESPVQVKAFGKDVLIAGAVHTDAEGKVEFIVPDLHLIFQFITDHQQQRIEPKVITEGRALEIRLYNFNNNLGTGVLSPISLGTFRGRPLSVVFTVYSLTPTSPKIFQYTFLAG
jgi:hypothetical protein